MIYMNVNIFNTNLHDLTTFVKIIFMKYGFIQEKPLKLRLFIIKICIRFL